MPFGLKNTEAAYQRLINMMFVELIGKTIEVYVDDMLVKSLQVNEHFLGYIVNQRGVEANPVKIRALLEMRATDKSLTFFKVLKQEKKFQWTDEWEEAFQALKKHLGEAPLLSKPKPQESLLLYLAVSNEAVSAVIVREENEHQLSVYYVSKALLSAETHYPDIEKLALALITASRKLRPYFQAHSIEVLTNFPLKQMLQRTEASGRLLKWVIELSYFDLLFQLRHVIKGQALADFVAEFAITPEMEAAIKPVESPKWNLFVDGCSGETGLGARIVRRLLASSNSQLVVSQVNGNFAAKDSSMAAYLKLVLDLVPHFERFELIQVPHLENTLADALSKLSSNKDSELLKIVPIERLSKPFISGGEELLWIESIPLWMQPIMAYLKDQSLPTSRSEARKLKRRVAHFILQKDVLYKRGFASPLLRCVGEEEASVYSGRSTRKSAKITQEEWLWHTKYSNKATSGQP
ncbi:uncharacterized protein LOC111406473 [Olea europaea var. sylvestris]|uniref:uncharacterized protein LOC111406473 n=1 Tax=Olea europaea var. sylvestris TaxID=158386 RepID=UPI000C1D0993|nr:uncharacterized protein LOC111406473 [Olea europaea var. sylvestris]